MREFHHEYFGGEIMIPDPKSLKAGYGSNHPEAYDTDDPRFLRQVMVEMGNRGLVMAFIVSKVSPYWLENRGEMVGGGIAVCEVQQCDGGYTEMGVNQKRIQR
jgi:hypothetical protein